jgi:hypothetical protein
MHSWNDSFFGILLYLTFDDLLKNLGVLEHRAAIDAVKKEE